MSRKRRHRLIAAGSATALIAPALAAVPIKTAGAYPRESLNNGCDHTFEEFDFLGSNWSDVNENYKDEWLFGAETWDNILDRYGNQRWFDGEGNRDATIRTDLGGTTQGNYQCFSFVEQNFYLDDGEHGQDAVYAAAHEAGHGHAMKHSGKANSSTNLPIMATCNDLPPALLTDDYAHALNTTEVTVHANPSFENGLTSWRSPNASLALSTSGGSEGPKYVGLHGLDTGANLQQWVRHVEPAPEYTGRANYKVASGTTGTITIQQRFRETDYNILSPDPCDYVNHWNLNDANHFDPTWYDVGAPRTVTPTTGWHYADTGPFGIAGFQAADMMIVVYKNTNHDVFLDNVRSYQS